MLPIAEVHRFAAAVPPHVATACVLLAAATLTLIIGLIRCGRAFGRWIPALLFVTAGTALLWPLSSYAPRLLQVAVAALGGVSLLVHTVLHYREWRAADDTKGDGLRGARVYYAAVLVLAVLLLFYKLGTYYGVLVAWEAPVVEGFAEAVEGGQSVSTFLTRRFYWDDGVLSGGQTSLFYGAPTYALFQLAGFSPLTLRFWAPIATLLCVVVLYVLGGRFFGPTVGGALAILYALNPTVLFYGRYGSSPAGTLLAVLLALWCTWLFLERDRPAWWIALACAVSFFLATLQYSPARVVVLILLGLLFAVGLWQWRQLWWRRALGLVLIGIVAISVWRFEGSVGRQGLFLHARGEQFFSVLENPASIESLIGHKVPNAPRPGAAVDFRGKLELLYVFLQTTVPQYVNLVTPHVDRPMGGVILGIDPPPLPLYYAPAVLFLLWGMLYSFARLPAFPHLCLFAWVGGATVPLLLTNRVDVHRLMLFVIPLTIWTALGVRDAARLLSAAKVPRLLQHLIAVALVVMLVYSNIHLLYYSPDQIPQPTAGPVLVSEIAAIPTPVTLGWDWDNREFAWVQLHMLERMRTNPHWRGVRMPQGLRLELQAEGGDPGEVALRNVQQVLKTNTVLLAPAARFQKAAAALQRRGLRVAERGTPAFRFIRIDGGAAVTGVPDDEVKPLPTIIIPPTPTPIPLQGGPQISLTELEPRDVSFGFAAPRMNHTWEGGIIRMGGFTYERGIGMHAWARMTFAVPPGATALQAIAGLSDSIKECSKASVTFEVRDDKGKVLYDSGIVDSASPPIAVHVDLHGTTAITLAVTDAGDGIDCDHANWAVPSFLLARR